MKTALILLALLIASVASASAQCICCSCTLDGTMRALLVPANPLNPLGAFTVTVKDNACNPLPNILVEVIVKGQVTGQIRLCAGAILSGRTNANGDIMFNIPGGGCSKVVNALEIRANNVVIRSYDVVVSPDYNGSDNVGQAGRSDLQVGLTDFVAFVAAYSGGPSCHDYNNDGLTSLIDFTLFGLLYGVRC